VPVVLEVEVPVAHGLLVLALKPLGLAGLCDLGRQNLKEVARELREFRGVELLGVGDHQLLRLADHTGRQVVGQVGQHSRDGPGLLREHLAIEG